jgi:hypothetical protein
MTAAATSTAADPDAAIQATTEAIRFLLGDRDFTVRVVTWSATTVRLYVDTPDDPLTAAEALQLLDRLSCTGQHSGRTNYTDSAGVTRMWGLRVVWHAAVYVGVVHASPIHYPST